MQRRADGWAGGALPQRAGGRVQHVGGIRACRQASGQAYGRQMVRTELMYMHLHVSKTVCKVAKPAGRCGLHHGDNRAAYRTACTRSLRQAVSSSVYYRVLKDHGSIRAPTLNPLHCQRLPPPHYVTDQLGACLRGSWCPRQAWCGRQGPRPANKLACD